MWHDIACDEMIHDIAKMGSTTLHGYLPMKGLNGPILGVLFCTPHARHDGAYPLVRKGDAPMVLMEVMQRMHISTTRIMP